MHNDEICVYVWAYYTLYGMHTEVDAIREQQLKRMQSGCSSV